MGSSLQDLCFFNFKRSIFRLFATTNGQLLLPINKVDQRSIIQFQRHSSDLKLLQGIIETNISMEEYLMTKKLKTIRYSN